MRLCVCKDERGKKGGGGEGRVYEGLVGFINCGFDWIGKVKMRGMGWDRLLGLDWGFVGFQIGLGGLCFYCFRSELVEMKTDWDGQDSG